MYSIGSLQIKVLVLCVVGLSLLNIVNLLLGQPFWIVTKIIYLGFDDNFAAWFSSMLLAIAGVLAHEASVTAKRCVGSGHVYLLMFSLLLFTMSADEVARIHETVGEFLSTIASNGDTSEAKNSGWVLVGGPIVLIVFSIAFYLLKPHLFLVKGTTTLLGLGFTSIFLGGVLLESAVNLFDESTPRWIWDTQIIVEETLEMIGTLLICLSLVRWRDGVAQKSSESQI